MPANPLKVLQDAVAGCTSCDLHKTRTNTVFARGNPEAAICFVGEAPGEDEDLQGLPFVGRSGKLLDQVLTEMGLDITKDIYVCNIVKCRPPNNRRPSEEETNHCSSWFEEQLDLVNPSIIIALGNTAVGELINTNQGVTKIHGQFFKCRIPVLYKRSTLVMPTYHPSFILRNGGIKSETCNQFRQDIQNAIDKLKEME